jgi:hypothetical protein
LWDDTVYGPGNIIEQNLFKSNFIKKQVDIYACGIIMGVLINKGKHPLLNKNDNQETYLNKVLNPVWKFENISRYFYFWD